MSLLYYLIMFIKADGHTFIMNSIKFSYVESAMASEAKLCRREDFDRVIDSAEVADLVGRIGQCEDKEKRGALKKRLPAFCFHATFHCGKRSNKDAICSGLFMIDLDDSKDDVSEVWSRIEAAVSVKDCRWKVYLSHMTPSGKGLRLVVRCIDGVSVPDCQKMFCAEMGLVNDPAVKDLARCSFAVPRDYFFRIDYSIFNDDAPLSPTPATGSVNRVSMMDELEAEGNMWDYVLTHDSPADEERLVFSGIPYSEIVERLCERLGCKVIEEGVRNHTLFRLATLLRNVCDYDPNVLKLILPKTTPALSDEELYSICVNACSRSMDAKMPRVLEEVVNSLKRERDDEGDAEVSDEPKVLSELPRMPKVFRTFADLCPPEYAEAMILSMLPVLGTLATGIRGIYNGNEPIRMNFQTLVVGPQASCKSRILKLSTSLLDSLVERDKSMRMKEREYDERARAGRGNKRGRKKKGEQQETGLPPKLPIRIIPASISISKLLERLENAGGKHLFSVENEIGTVANTNRSGAWSKKMEIYKNAFDNELYGQDYRSEDSYSAILPVVYNYLFAGTYEAVMDFYDNHAVKSGLASRTIVAYVPDTFASKRPVFKSLSEKGKSCVDSVVECLEAYNKEVHCPKLAKAIDAWLEKCAKEALEANDKGVDFFCRRSAVIGFKAGLLAYVLEGEKETRTVTDFATWVAECVMRNQIRLWGDLVEEQSDIVRTPVHKQNLFEKMPQVFSRGELKSSVNDSNGGYVRQIICRWKKARMIEELPDGKFAKTTSSKSA